MDSAKLLFCYVCSRTPISPKKGFYREAKRKQLADLKDVLIKVVIYVTN